MTSNYPPGAGDDPRAPFNQPAPDDDSVCPACGEPSSMLYEARFEDWYYVWTSRRQAYAELRKVALGHGHDVRTFNGEVTIRPVRVGLYTDGDYQGDQGDNRSTLWTSIVLKDGHQLRVMETTFGTISYRGVDSRDTTLPHPDLPTWVGGRDAGCLEDEIRSILTKAGLL